MERATDKQVAYVQRIVNERGKEYVQSYIRHFYPNADIDNLSKTEAQKIITGVMTNPKPISNVYLRDYFG